MTMKVQSDNTCKVPGHCEGLINDSKYHLYFKFIVPSLEPRAFKESELLWIIERGICSILCDAPIWSRIAVINTLIILQWNLYSQKQDQ